MSLSDTDRPEPSDPEPTDAAARIALAMGRQLVGLVRLLGDLGHPPEVVRKSVVAAHRAGLRRLIKHDATLAVEVADMLREGVGLVIKALDEAIAERGQQIEAGKHHIVEQILKLATKGVSLDLAKARVQAEQDQAIARLLDENPDVAEPVADLARRGFEAGARLAADVLRLVEQQDAAAAAEDREPWADDESWRESL